jgi:hypothetical protein
MEANTHEQYVRGRNARIKSASLGHHLSELLRINKYNRMVRALRELHEKQEAERIKRELAGLPPLLPPPPVAKPTKEKKPRTKNPEAPPPKPSRTSSAPKQRTAYANAELERTMRASALFAHNRVDKLQEETLAKLAKAQTIAAQLAAAVVDERKSLATTHTDIGEESLKAISEAAYKAEARAQALKASASNFDGVVPRARARFTAELTKSRNETYANHERRENKNFISKWGGQIFSRGTDRMNEALSANLQPLANKWKYIARIGRYLEESNNVEADNITVLINEAQSIKLASDEALKLRNKAGFKRTKKHRKKRRKTRNNRTNKFVAQKH